MITPVGELTLGETIPGAVAVGVAGAAGINLALPNIQETLDALLAFSPAPVDFNAQLNLALQTVASIQAGISAGLTPPDIAAQIAIIAAQIAALAANVGTINAQLTIITDFQSLLSAAGIFVYAYAGDVGDFGTELQAEIGAGIPPSVDPGDNCNGLVLLTTVPATWAAMSEVFKVSP